MQNVSLYAREQLKRACSCRQSLMASALSDSLLSSGGWKTTLLRSQRILDL